METKDFNIIIAELRQKLEKYSKQLKVTKDTGNAYELYIDKPGVLGGRKYDNLFFASAVMQKGHVGFYFFPIYTHPLSFNNVPGELRKTLKGKSCFNIKKWDDTLSQQVDDLLKDGFQLYQKEGLI